MKSIGFIGLGKMGSAIAGNLLKAGFDLHVHNRTPDKAAALVAQGAKLAHEPGDTVQPGGIVITMLANDRALEDVVDGDRGFVERLGPEGIHLSMSTVSPRLANRLAEQHRRSGVEYVAAPVFGRPEAAAARKLWICLSGSPMSKQRVRPILDSIGQGTFDFGEEPAAAHVVKLAGNFLLASAVESLAEALVLGEKNGIDRSKLADMLGSTLFACPAYQTYGRVIAQQRFRPAGFTVELGLKDIDLVLQTAADSTTPLPLAGLLHDRFLAAVAKGRGELDWSSVWLESAENARLSIEYGHDD
ncbi:MAG: NAD(P)-dependent oxidoreductase [Nitrospira sp.]|jgi:3-hydroxyisobutyrate dehydrogenase-like beta-hydroxyacid dehydrogenase|nr:NAD(P)-dependent oxidoreductase [Nitrospira sp.]MDI3464596.1 3-hydroxyisobutyrate dehydrogenase family protein [Nitrospira sp.]